MSDGQKTNLIKHLEEREVVLTKEISKLQRELSEFKKGKSFPYSNISEVHGSIKRKNYDDEIFEVDSEQEINSDITFPMTITPVIVKEVPRGSTSNAHITSNIKAPALSYSKVVTSGDWRVSGRGGSDKNASNKFTNSMTLHSNGKATVKPKNDNKRKNKFVEVHDCRVEV